MVTAQGDVVWVDFGMPEGSEMGYRHPAIVVQNDVLNQSHLATVVVVPLTSNLRWADAEGNVRLRARATGLPKDSVARAVQITTIDKSQVQKRVATLSPANFDQVLNAIRFLLSRIPPAIPR